MNIEILNNLVGKDLSAFKLTEMTEVYRVNYEGLFTESLGFFKDATVAGAFAGPQGNDNYTKKRTQLVLTDGTVGFVIVPQEPVKFLNDEAEAAKLKTAALELLSPEQRKLLGLA